MNYRSSNDSLRSMMSNGRDELFFCAREHHKINLIDEVDVNCERGFSDD
jgi:hypothetical protein